MISYSQVYCKETSDNPNNITVNGVGNGYLNYHNQFRSVSKSWPTLCHQMDCSTPGLYVYHQLPELLKLMSIESVMLYNHLTLYSPLILLPSILPSIRVFSNESVFHIRWPKYWSFSFNISPSNYCSGLISFRID